MLRSQSSPVICVFAALSVLTLAACGESETTPETPAATAPQDNSSGALGSCASLVAEDFSDTVGSVTTVTEAEDIPATAELPAHCRALAVIAPETGVEVRLPDEWNGRFLFTGCGGLCGVIRSEQGDDALARGYAVATTDMGHTTPPDGDRYAFTADPELVMDWQHRATHRATRLAKAVIASHYGKPQDYAYIRGCSTGGRQGLTAALMYPGDFDGVIAGAPAMEMVSPHNVFAYQASQRPDGSPIFTPEALTLLNDAVLAACEMDDGLADGVIGDPQACAFDPAALVCSGNNTDGCLTAEQAAAAQAIYDGARRADGSPFYAMGYAKGTERDWISAFLETNGNPPRRAGSTRFILDRKIGPQATVAQFDFAEHGATGSPVGGLLDFGEDGRKLEDFTAQGGKVLIYHGWSDTDAIPASSLFFHDAQVDAFGADAVPDFLRMFFLPGMRHCRGGPGVDIADYLTVMEAWVERGEAPDSLTAYRTSNPPRNYLDRFPLDPANIDAARTLYPYPANSAYTGSGDPADPANWGRID
jgi:hypothetical protein